MKKIFQIFYKTKPKEGLSGERRTEYKYDALKERINKISGLANEQGYSENAYWYSYDEKGRMEKIYTYGVESYETDYDHFGRLKTFKQSNKEIMGREYTMGEESVERTAYANGYSEEITTDRYGIVTQKKGRNKVNDTVGAYTEYEDKLGNESSSKQLRRERDDFAGEETYTVITRTTSCNRMRKRAKR